MACTLQPFSHMLVHGISPDGVTFLRLLTACSHAGLVDQGLMFFNAMKEVYRIVLETQHHACLVDVYGRAGLSEESEAFIKEMPTKVNGPVRGVLLSACNIHGNEKVVERIRQGLPNNAGVSVGTYALLSNPFAKHDRLDDSYKVCDEIRMMGLKTEPGCSCIKIGPSV